MLVVTCRLWRRKPSYNGLSARYHNGMAESGLRSTAKGGKALTLTERCDISCHMTGYHAPHETGEFPCDCCFCNIRSLVVFKNHPIILSSQTLISFISISYDFGGIPFLAGLQCFGFETDLSPTIALSCFYQQASDMAVSGFGDAETIFIIAA